MHAAPEANGRGDEGRDARHGIKTSKQAKGDRASKSKQTCDAAPRPNTLVPTNGIHSTERRAKRPLHQNRTVLFLVGATLIGILILGEQTEPPDMSAFEQQFAAGQTSHTRAWSDGPVPAGMARPGVEDVTEESSAQDGRVATWYAGTRDLIAEPDGTSAQSEPTAASEAPPGAQVEELDSNELAEMERLLARMDLEPSTADGIVDRRTRLAIRMYQQFAGLPIDGQPSPDLLVDMREVVKFLDNGS